ncbi:hypothetical protein F4859DRAFT_515298 [Xylaria cf. heliscus]|nr:hypothetical protein F4859DRAFT_515298 [Xylaria cf. heliscus]
MASRNPVGGASLPRTFRCRICGQNKAPAAYSKNQLQKWYNKKRNDHRNQITPESIGLSCKDHNNDEREIRCHGPCDRVKVVGQFSKAQRNNPEPWCINCTEWRLSFDGREIPDYVPNGSLVHDGYDGIGDNEEFVQEPFHEASSDEDEEDDDDDDDDFDDRISPYSGKSLVSSFVDRLEGYGDEATGKDVTTDTMSTTYGTDISCWNDNANDDGSDSGSDKSAKTATGMRSIATQSGRMVADVAMSSQPGQETSRSPGYMATASNTASLSMATAPAEVAHLTRLAAGLGLNHETLNTQSGQFAGPGDISQTFSSRFSASRPAPRQMSEVGVGGRPFGVANKPMEPTKSYGCKQTSENQRPGKGNNKWYKGDNRKVFPGKKKAFAARAEDGTEAAHDSDSPDEM